MSIKTITFTNASLEEGASEVRTVSCELQEDGTAICTEILKSAYTDRELSRSVVTLAELPFTETALRPLVWKNILEMNCFPEIKLYAEYSADGAVSILQCQSYGSKWFVIDRDNYSNPLAEKDSSYVREGNDRGMLFDTQNRPEGCIERMFINKLPVNWEEAWETILLHRKLVRILLSRRH